MSLRPTQVQAAADPIGTMERKNPARRGNLIPSDKRVCTDPSGVMKTRLRQSRSRKIRLRRSWLTNAAAANAQTQSAGARPFLIPCSLAQIWLREDERKAAKEIPASLLDGNDFVNEKRSWCPEFEILPTIDTVMDGSLKTLRKSQEASGHDFTAC